MDLPSGYDKNIANWNSSMTFLMEVASSLGSSNLFRLGPWLPVRYVHELWNIVEYCGILWICGERTPV